MTTRRQDSTFDLCTFQFANGKLCGMPKHNGLCLNHATIHRRTSHREDDLSADLATFTGEFITSTDINQSLGQLYHALAANRVSPKRAAILAYIGGLLLQSRSGVEPEAARAGASHNWDKMLHDLFKVRDGIDPATSNPSPSDEASSSTQ
jgi:hypothetical protein